MFGRAFAASAYGLAKILYAAEYAGLPPEPYLAELVKVTAALVDRGQAPNTRERRFAGVAAALLAGNPKEGGFGCLHFVEHVRARHAMWAVRLMLGSTTVPWVFVARHIMSGELHPAVATQQHCAIAMSADLHKFNGVALPPTLARLAAGINALPGWIDCRLKPLGAWCNEAPLWGNPFLVARAQGAALPRHGLEQAGFTFMQGGRLFTLGDLLQLRDRVTPEMPHQQFMDQVYPLWLYPRVDLQDQATAQHVVAGLVNAVDPAWVTAAEQASAWELLAAPSTAEITSQLQQRLSWFTPQGKVVKLETASVRLLTQLQLRPMLAQRAAKHAAFLHMVNTGLPPQLTPAADAVELAKLQAKLWKLPWDNAKKELLWRLSVDGKATLARMHVVGGSCTCGAVAPSILHHFWQCPVAEGVVALLKAQLPELTRPLHTVHVWMARPPIGGVHKGVWLVVCQAALLAMDQGRALLCKWQKQLDNPGEGPLPQHLHSAQQRMQAAGRAAQAAFWDRLHDFVGLGSCPVVWLDHIRPNHPFLTTVGAGDDKALRVNRVVPPA